MQYVDGTGLMVSQREIGALLAFTGHTEKTDGVGVRISGGDLLVWACSGHSAAYHHSSATDGKGGKYRGSHEWQIGADALERIRKSMSAKDEAVIAVNRNGRITEARIRDIESAQESIVISLEGHVADQLGLPTITEVVPTRPEPSSMVCGQLGISTSLLALLRKVGAAVESDAARFTFPADWTKPIYIEVDTPSALADSQLARWVIVLMPLGPFSSSGDDPVDELRKSVARGEASVKAVGVEP